MTWKVMGMSFETVKERRSRDGIYQTKYYHSLKHGYCRLEAEMTLVLSLTHWEVF